MNTPEFTTQAFLDWLRQQPKEREFDYWDGYNCAVASFAKEELGYGKVKSTSTHLEIFVDGEDFFVLIPSALKSALDYFGVTGKYFTAGQLLEKLTTA
jgi:hypothetical protein